MEKNLQMVALKYVKIILNIEDLMGMNYVDVEYEVVSQLKIFVTFCLIPKSEMTSQFPKKVNMCVQNVLL